MDPWSCSLHSPCSHSRSCHRFGTPLFSLILQDQSFPFHNNNHNNTFPFVCVHDLGKKGLLDIQISYGKAPWTKKEALDLLLLLIHSSVVTRRIEGVVIQDLVDLFNFLHFSLCVWGVGNSCWRHTRCSMKCVKEMLSIWRLVWVCEMKSDVFS